MKSPPEEMIMTRHEDRYWGHIFENINLFGKFYAAQARQYLYKKELLKLSNLPQLPDEIAEKIALLCWNPWLLFDKREN